MTHQHTSHEDGSNEGSQHMFLLTTNNSYLQIIFNTSLSLYDSSNEMQHVYIGFSPTPILAVFIPPQNLVLDPQKLGAWVLSDEYMINPKLYLPMDSYFDVFLV